MERKLYLSELLNEEGNCIDYTKITKEFIINSNDEYFEAVKRFTLSSMEKMFYLYSYKSLEYGSLHDEKWIYEKIHLLERLEYLYIIVYNDMFERSAKYNDNDIINYQIAFSDSIRKNKNILNGFRTR